MPSIFFISMNRYFLPTSIEIAGVEVPIYSDYRDILEIFEVFNDPDLLESEKVFIALQMFYKNEDYLKNIEEAARNMVQFIDGGDTNESAPKNEQPLYSWEQDFNIIVSPINRVLGKDVRGVEYLHWWTFLSAFMEIGECTFNTYVGIRDKLNKHIKLEKWEEKIYNDNRDKITLKKKYDTTTQSLIDEIMGKGV